MLPPLALDIDGTLTTPEKTIDPRAFDALAGWPAPVVLATGKAFPYPVTLCHFVGIPELVVAEHGGVVLAEDDVRYAGDPERVEAAVEAFQDRGGDLGWGVADTINRWRETEVAISLDADADLLADVAAEFDLDLVDSGYAYHLKTPGVEKADGLELVADAVGREPGEFVAVGDSENDVSTFGVAGESYAVANADDRAKAAADEVVPEGYFDGTLSVLAALRDRTED